MSSKPDDASVLDLRIALRSNRKYFVSARREVDGGSVHTSVYMDGRYDEQDSVVTAVQSAHPIPPLPPVYKDRRVGDRQRGEAPPYEPAGPPEL